jgi:hypothetical protein
MLTCVLATTACACSADPTPTPAAQGETTGTTEQKQVVGATGNIMIWPAGGIAWDGLTGTWPISVWSSGPIGGLAFDMFGATDLGLSCLGCGAGILPIGITTPWLNAFVPTAGAAAFGAPLLGRAGLFAPGFGFQGAFSPFTGVDGVGFSAFAPGLGLSQGSFVDGALGGLTPFLTPTLTNSALMFTDLNAIDVFTPFTFNVSFTAQSAAAQSAIESSSASFNNFGSLSIFATPIGFSGLGTAGAFPFTSMLFPFSTPLGLGVGLGTGLAGPLL